MPRIVPNGGYSVETPSRWNIHPGMKPIKWTISPYVKTLAADPFYGRYDIAGAVKRGVENWNAAFGYKVLEATVGAADARRRRHQLHLPRREPRGGLRLRRLADQPQHR
jgi:hypothetical protein